MFSRTLLAATLAASSLSAFAGDVMQTPLTLGEHYTLRSYTGQAIGLTLTNVLKAKTVGYMVNDSSICASLTGAAAGEAVAHNNQDGALLVGALAAPGDAGQVVGTLTGKDVIGLMFGGQTPPQENAALVQATLAALAKADYQGAIFFHLAVWASGMAEKASQADPAIARYLAGKQNLYALTVGKDKGLGLVHQVRFVDGKQASVKIAHEVKMNDAWLNLFKRSLLRRG